MRLDEALPELSRFLEELGADVCGGVVRSQDLFVERCRVFYTPEQMAQIEAVVPGWRHMSSFADGETLWHVTACMVTLPTLDEYRAEAPATQETLRWVVLLHDLAKEPAGGRDYRHAFRSAALAGRILPGLGFPVADSYAEGIRSWFDLTDIAHRHDEALGVEVADNSKLQEILRGCRRIFQEPTRAAVVAIALHQSITVLAAWPAKAPLTEDEVAAYVDEEARRLLLVLMLTDHGGWNLFDDDLLAAMYAETRAIFCRLPGPADSRPWRT